MKTNALFSNKSFPAVSSAPKRTVPALEKHTTGGSRNIAGCTQAEEDLLQ